jgi:H+/Cl- antiporter ClcA
MARYGSERIRGHGIPEAMEAILIGQSRMMPRVAILKPLSSAISIGSGGPFGAEGPIIMTGGAFGSSRGPGRRRKNASASGSWRRGFLAAADPGRRGWPQVALNSAALSRLSALPLIDD